MIAAGLRKRGVLPFGILRPRAYAMTFDRFWKATSTVTEVSMGHAPGYPTVVSAVEWSQFA